MSLTLPDAWVWDFWTAYDEEQALHHVFFLHAPTSLGDPEQRHRNARIGHAVSADLRTWRRRPDPLPDVARGFDDLAAWTGCTVRADDRWWLFQTGLSAEDGGLVQRIGAATSRDLTTWQRTDLRVTADPRHYQQSCAAWPEEAWRDPWVVPDADGTWHMYVTARAASGDPGCGVVGHAVSDDLRTWEVRPPLSRPTGVFEWLEVLQLVQVEGRWALLFSCLGEQMHGAAPGAGGVWSVPVAGPGAPVDVAAARRLTDESLYVGKVVHHDGSPYFLAFRNRDRSGRFVGGLTDPSDIRWRQDGEGLALAAEPSPP